MKKRWNCRRYCAVCMAGILMAGSSFPAVSAAAESSPALRIGQTVFDPDSLGEDRIVTVDIFLDANGAGFLAAEFGIQFDSRLAVADIRTPEEIAGSFVASCSNKNSMVWFCGAAVDEAPLFSGDSASLFQVDFVLPEDITPDDSYDIDYIWNGLDGAPAFWYAARGQNVIDGMKANSVPGMLTQSGAETACFDQSEVTLNQGESFRLTAQHVSGEGIWFSDHPEIASVEDGVVTAHSPGNCVISAFFADSDALLSCEVTVHREFYYSILDADPITITSRDQVVILEFPDAVGTVQWLSTMPGVVTVEDGLLTAVADGTAHIIATNHGVSKMRTVIVKLEDLPTEPPALASGDLNGDDAIDITDVIAVNKFLLGSATLEARQRAAADVYHDGLLDTTDALTLLKYVVEMLPALPIEPT